MFLWSCWWGYLVMYSGHAISSKAVLSWIKPWWSTLMMLHFVCMQTFNHKVYLVISTEFLCVAINKTLHTCIMGENLYSKTIYILYMWPHLPERVSYIYGFKTHFSSPLILIVISIDQQHMYSYVIIIGKS